MNTTSISTITTTFETLIVKKCQCTVCAGWLRLKIAAMRRRYARTGEPEGWPSTRTPSKRSVALLTAGGEGNADERPAGVRVIRTRFLVARRPVRPLALPWRVIDCPPIQRKVKSVPWLEAAQDVL